MLKYRRNNVLTKIENLKEPKHIVFGGKKNLKNLDKNEELELRKNLLKYCELDTLAMVKIYDKLREVS